MAKVTKELTVLDRAIAEHLVQLIEASGISRRELRSATGLSLSRLHTIVTMTSPPMTVGELHTIACAVGSTAWEILDKVTNQIGDGDLTALYGGSPSDFALAATDNNYDEEGEAQVELP